MNITSKQKSFETLGILIFEEKSRKSHLFMLGMCIVVFAFLTTVSLFYIFDDFPSKNRNVISFFACTSVGFCILTFIAARQFVSNTRLRFRVYERGLQLQTFRSERTIYWDNLNEFRLYINWWRNAMKRELFLHDFSDFTLPTSLYNFRKVTLATMKVIDDFLVHKYSDLIENNGEFVVGNLIFSTQGISRQANTIMWAEIEALKPEFGAMKITTLDLYKEIVIDDKNIAIWSFIEQYLQANYGWAKTKSKDFGHLYQLVDTSTITRYASKHENPDL